MLKSGSVPGHEFKDAYRMLRTRVLQTLRENNWTSVAVTGPASGCGKTLTAINLAISLAMEVTHTVLLVDLDLRKPSIHEYFGYQPETGLSDYLLNDTPINQIMFSPNIERLESTITTNARWASSVVRGSFGRSAIATYESLACAPGASCVTVLVRTAAGFAFASPGLADSCAASSSPGLGL